MNTSLPPTSLNNSQRAENLSREVKHKITEITKRVKGALHPSEPDIRYLFEIFDQHITPYPPEPNMRCNDCRVMVRGFWIHEVEKWKS